MAFNVNFWTFSKKARSTAQPAAGQATVYSCTANGDLDLLAPVIRLKIGLDTATPPTVYNYAQIPNFGRYYFVDGWTVKDGLWEARLTVDPWASWKTQLGLSSVYVYRSSYSYNLKLADSMYPVTAKRRAFNVSLPRPFTIGGSSAGGAAVNTGVYVLGIISEAGTNYYGFTESQLIDFMDAIFSQNYYNAILTDFGAQNFPEAKVAINPLQYVSSARFFPMQVLTTLWTHDSWALLAATASSVQIGAVSLQQSAYQFVQVSGTPVNLHTQILYHDYSVTSDFLHPQADARGDWLNLSPYTRYEMFYPPFGIVQLDPEAISNATTIRVQLTIDTWTGNATLEVIMDPGTNERVILRLSSYVAVDVPLSNLQTLGHSTMELAALGTQALQSALSLSPSGVAAAEQAAAKTIVDGWIPHLSTMGSQGATAQLVGDPKIMVTHWYLADDDLADIGRPLCQVKQISAIPGFIRADADGLSLSCTMQELEEIKTGMMAGMYYE